MPVKIRLARHGKKSRPHYIIVAADSRAPRDGKFIERIGIYNPITNPAIIDLDFEKALSWLQKGAQPTDTVRTLLKHKGVLFMNHLQKGVLKGALSQEQADQKFEEWKVQAETQTKNLLSKMEGEERTEAKNKLAGEIKVKETRSADLAKKNAKASMKSEKAEEVEETIAVEPVAEEVKMEEPVVEEVKMEEPVAEAPKADEPAPEPEAPAKEE